MLSPRCLRGRLSAGIALLAACVGCGEVEPPPELPPRAIQWLRIADAVSGEQRVISGIVTAISDTELAFEVGGLVETVEVALGDVVEKGQVLARLDPEPFRLTVSDAEAGLAEALALRESARADYERAVHLYEEKVASRQEFDRATARRDSRESQVDAVQARLSLAERDLRRSVLRAPFAGAISVRQIDPAMKLASGQVVFEMDSAESGLRVEVQMPETLIARVRQGGAVGVRFPSIASEQPDLAGRSYEAIITEVGTRAGTGNAFPVRADLVEAPTGLRPGMTAEVSFSIPRNEAGIAEVDGFLIPLAAALAEADNQFSVFVFDPASSTVSKRAIRTGGVRDNDVAVLDGLSAGEIIATAGVTFLREGQTVSLLDGRLVRHAP